MILPVQNLERRIGKIFLENPLIRFGNIENLDIEDLARIAGEENPGSSQEIITATIESLLGHVSQAKTPEQRAQSYKQVNELYVHAKSGNRDALVRFVEENFNRPYNGGSFFDELTVQVLAFALEYTLVMHGDALRKIKTPNEVMALYSGHPIQVALTYVGEFDKVSKMLAEPDARLEFHETHGKQPRRRVPYFADVITLLWHDLPEEEGIGLDQIERCYTEFIDNHIGEGYGNRFKSATQRILIGIQDLTREGDYFDLIKDMLEKGRRAYLMTKASDKIANLGEMDDIPGRSYRAYSHIRDRVIGLMGFDNRITRILRRGKNRITVAVRALDRKVSHRLDRNVTYNTADRVKDIFEGLLVVDTINRYLVDTEDSDPYLIQLRARLVKAVLERGDHTEFHLLNYHCRDFDMPINLSNQNWRLHKHVEENGKRSNSRDTTFLDSYLDDDPKVFDLEVRTYLDGQLRQAVEDRTLFKRTPGERGGPFDGLIDHYYSKLIRAPAEEISLIREEILGNRTLQYMLTTALIKLAEQYRDDTLFTFRNPGN